MTMSICHIKTCQPDKSGPATIHTLMHRHTFYLAVMIDIVMDSIIDGALIHDLTCMEINS